MLQNVTVECHNCNLVNGYAMETSKMSLAIPWPIATLQEPDLPSHGGTSSTCGLAQVQHSSAPLQCTRSGQDNVNSTDVKVVALTEYEGGPALHPPDEGEGGEEQQHAQGEHALVEPGGHGGHGHGGHS